MQTDRQVALRDLTSTIEALGFSFAGQGAIWYDLHYMRLYLPEDRLGINRDEALISALDAHLGQYPNDCHALYSRAFSYYFREEPREALQYARAALEARPKHYAALQMAVGLLIELNEHSEALPLAQRLLLLETSLGIKGSGHAMIATLNGGNPAWWEVALAGDQRSGEGFSYSFDVPCITYWDGTPHRFYDSRCTVTATNLVVRDSRGSTQQTRIADIASVGPRIGLFSGHTVEIKIGARALLEVTCRSREQRDEVVREVGRAITSGH